MKMVVLDAATFGEISLGPLTGGAEDCVVHQHTRADQTAARIAGAQIVVSNKVYLGVDELQQAPGLKLICVAATGVNNVDLEAAQARGIAVTNVPAYSTPSVVAHTFALYFHMAHHNSYHDDYTREAAWCTSPIFTHLDKPYHELAALTWGIIGLGAIGRGVAQVAQAFGARVVYHSTSGTNLDQPYTHLNLQSLLAQADVVSIHAPLNSRTHDLIDAAALRLMKRDAYLINVGRGGIVNEADLAAALDAGVIAGAGIDVVSVEPPDVQHPFMSMLHPNRLFLTPHIAGLSIEARTRLVQGVRDNIDAFKNGVPRNSVLDL